MLGHRGHGAAPSPAGQQLALRAPEDSIAHVSVDPVRHALQAEGTRFHRVIGEGAGPAKRETIDAEDAVQKVVLCSGKVYYDLQKARELNGVTSPGRHCHSTLSFYTVIGCH
jgi:hypothetical protein